MITYIMRHASRFDKRNNTWKDVCEGYLYDTPLSTHGMRQAIERGDQLKDREIEKIYASPFTRAVQTAQIIASIIDKPIIIDARLSEILRRKWFKHGINIQPKHMHYPSITKVNRDFSNIPYPEGHDGVIARTKEFVEEEPIDNCLLVSHGTTCRRLTQNLTNFEIKVRMPHCSQVYVVEDKNFLPWPL